MEKKTLTLDEAIEKIPVGKFQYGLLLLCGLAFCSDALEVVLLSFVATCAGDDWDLSNTQTASIASVVFVGIMIGNFFWGKMAERYGRKYPFLGSCAIMSIFGLISGGSPSYAWLLVFRAIVGFGVAGALIPFDLLAEFTPSSHRGVFLVYIQYFWSFGSLFVAGVAWGTLSNYGWRFLCYICAVPVTLASIFGMLYLSESPRWLLLKGRKEEAEEVIRKAAKVNGVVLPDFSLSEAGLDEEEKDANYLDLITKPEIRKISLPLWTIYLMYGFTYYGVILFVNRLYSNLNSDDGDDDGSSCDFDYSAIFINSSAEVVGFFLPSLLIDRLGRRGSQVLWYGLGGLMVFIMGFGLNSNGLIVIAYLARMAAMAATDVTWVTTPELFTTDVRTMGHAVGASASKLGAFCTSYLVLSNINDIGLALTLAIFNFIAVGASIMLPDTTGVSLDPVREKNIPPVVALDTKNVLHTGSNPDLQENLIIPAA